MITLSNSKSGFTLVEICISVAILVIVVAMTMAGLLHTMSSHTQTNVQAELDVNVQASMERLKQDLRLTSLDKCVFYPAGPGPYAAISFPIAEYTNGVVATDSNGKIIWNETVIYHVWTGVPYQLRRTVFNPRPSLTDVQLQEQINSVVTNGNGSATYGSSVAATEVVFEDLFNWSIDPQQVRVDGYSSNTMSDVVEDLGFATVTSGVNTFTFQSIDKNLRSSGYAIGVDTLAVTPSYGVREAEAQLPVTAQSGATAVSTYAPDGDWSGNYYLSFPATATGQYFTVSLENDRWEETNFRGAGFQCHDTEIAFDETLSPKDYVVRLTGSNFAWFASDQTGDHVGSGTNGSLSGCAVRVLVKGRNMDGGEWIKYNGSKCYVWFDAAGSSSKLMVQAAYIAECANQCDPSPDIAAGTSRQMTFAGSTSKLFPDGSGSNWSDRLNFPIDRDKTYVVSFLVGNVVGQGNAWCWKDSNPTGLQCYVKSSGTAGDLTTALWSTDTNVVSTNSLYAVHYLWAQYPTNAYYISRICDTHLDTPVYSTIGWNASVPSGSTLQMRTRTATNEFMSDAPDWTNVTAQTSQGTLSPYPGSHRYVQFRADLLPDAACTVSPVLNDVTIRWPGVTKMVDLTANMCNGTNFGICSFAVNGVAVKRGLTVNLTIFEDVRSFGQQVRLTSTLSSEVRPRNTGR